MQVFVTSPDFVESARVLDNKRCNKQIVECNQMYLAIIGVKQGWRNHCVTRLWEKYQLALMAFATACYDEMKQRGYNPTLPALYVCPENLTKRDVPHFLLDSKFTDAMKSHLLAKDYTFYSKNNWTVPTKSGYYGLNKNYQMQMYSVK